MTDLVYTPEVGDRIAAMLTELKLVATANELVRRLLDAGEEGALVVVAEVLELELEGRMGRRVERLRRSSKLPLGKTLATLDRKRVPKGVMHRVDALARGDFLSRGENVLIFGRPGVGKSHIACALGHALVEHGHSVLYTPTYQLVQRLLAARRDLALPRALRQLDGFDLVILDDIGYVQQSPDEAEVLFTLMAERYERRSLMITSNLVFSDWGRIFTSPMTTAAAIDRLVHHATILEIERGSIRAEDAEIRNKGGRRKKEDPES
ncbi:MAG: IS21-like element helper ATPase IstB [Myxococcales bacterium]|nr:IS21-like element helper ATPase IstB [Myxococcales bacterium]